ncbi:hypothetical protein OIDMADRAFT_125866 [Oidiodendron maius Zn]|uniref:FAD-binding domain-containing protein n=1 Tax=Oidiodendron maius (strain Zn) TaxID=913774 RepID=A0A0C3DDG2_OIDMZ|nr:hypothetical protein OIDMADRAFT_125866 [Oidiodendron maius Zn]
MAEGKDFHVAVCGGGIGGLCLTIGLLRQNISCKLYEAAPAFAEIGAGVSFGPNAIQAMELIDPQIVRGFENCSTINGWPEKRDTWFEFRTGQAKGTRRGVLAATNTYVADVKTGGVQYVGQNSVHRAHFLDELVKLIPDEVPEFGKRLVNIEEKGDKMILAFEDGTSSEADAVIGCDGIKSRMREILLGKDHEAAHAVFSGKYAYRGLIPMETAVNALGDELARNPQMYMGHHGHVLTFPIEKGKTMNVVAFRTKLDGKWPEKDWILPSKKEDMTKDFMGWDDRVMNIIYLMEKCDVWALFEHLPSPTYYKGRLCLLGDAAHASTPHQGAGAGQAIEDAFILSNLLGQVASVADITRSFKAYDSVRRSRSQRVVTTSKEAGCLYEMEDEEVGSDLDKARENLLARYDWIWRNDLKAQLREAKNVMLNGSRI